MRQILVAASLCVAPAAIAQSLPSLPVNTAVYYNAKAKAAGPVLFGQFAKIPRLACDLSGFVGMAAPVSDLNLTNFTGVVGDTATWSWTLVSGKPWVLRAGLAVSESADKQWGGGFVVLLAIK